VPVNPDRPGQARNKIFRVTVGDKVISLKQFCKGLGLSYESMLRACHDMGFGEIHAPFIEVTNAMRRRAGLRQAARIRCSHCGGTGIEP
jgi:hypothetical protein